WFLDVNVGAGSAGFNHREAMPMVRRADENDFGAQFSEQFAVIAKDRRFLFGRLTGGDEFARGRRRFAVHIAEADDFDGRDLDEMEEIGFAVPTAADERDAERFVFVGGEEERLWCGGSGCSDADGFEEVSSVHS